MNKVVYSGLTIIFIRFGTCSLFMFSHDFFCYIQHECSQRHKRLPFKYVWCCCCIQIVQYQADHFLRQLSFDPQNTSRGSRQNRSENKHFAPLLSSCSTTTTIKQIVMQIPSNVWQEMNILALLFCVKFPDLSAMLCFQSMKLVNGAKKGFCFTSCSMKLLTFMRSEKIFKHVAILCRLKCFHIAKTVQYFPNRFVQNLRRKLYTHTHS